jgi:hypothetical protein
MPAILRGSGLFPYRGLCGGRTWAGGTLARIRALEGRFSPRSKPERQKQVLRLRSSRRPSLRMTSRFLALRMTNLGVGNDGGIWARIRELEPQLAG